MAIGFGYLFDNIGNFTIHVIYHGVVLIFIGGVGQVHVHSAI